MAKPILKKIFPFDATVNTEISFVWNGNRAYRNRILVCDNDTLAVVYDHTETTYALSHTIPQYLLKNRPYLYHPMPDI